MLCRKGHSFEECWEKNVEICLNNEVTHTKRSKGDGLHNREIHERVRDEWSKVVRREFASNVRSGNRMSVTEGLSGN